MFSKSKIIIFLILLAEFVVVISFGYFMIEKAKEMTAKAIGYDSYYNSGLARLMFFNNDKTEKMIKLRKRIDGENRQISASLKNNAEWKNFERQNQIDYSIIRLSGIILVLLISLIGFFLWKRHDKQNTSTKWIHLVFLILSLFFMREAIISLERFIHGSMVCDEVMIWALIGTRWIYAEPTVILSSLMLLLFVLFKYVPKEIRISFIIAVFFGSAISFLIIIKFIGPRLL